MSPPPPSSLLPIKLRMETFWYELTQVHLEKWSLKCREIVRKRREEWRGKERGREKCFYPDSIVLVAVVVVVVD